MIKRLMLCLVILSGFAFGQAVRYDSIGQGLASGNVFVPIANGAISVYNYPGPTTNCATAGTCTLATTFTDDTNGSSCPTATQLTRPTTNSCIGTLDSGGNFGFWISPGPYQYCISATSFATSCTNITVPTAAFNTTNCTAAGFTAVLAELPSTGGVLDGRACKGAIAWGGTLTLNKPVSLLLPKPGAATFTAAICSSCPAIMVASSNVTVDGGSFILSGPQVHGVRWTGPTSHTVIENMTITGSGSLSDNQNGILGFNAGGVNSDIKILNNTISQTTIGIIFNAFLVGESYSNIDIEGNTVFSIVGTASGTGYGINVASGMGTGNGDVIGVRIAHNYLEDVGRHSIYTGFGRQFVVDGNIIKNHSLTAGGSGIGDKAIECSRVQDVVISNNVLYSPWGGGIEVVTQPDFLPDSKFNKNTILSNNVVFDPHIAAAFIVGTSGPATDGFPTSILVNGNSCYSTADPTIKCLEIASGKNITISNNHLQVVGATGLTNVVGIDGSGETAGTSTYNDNIEFHGNTLVADFASAALVRVESAAATSSSIITFNQNIFEGLFVPFFFPGSALTDPNFTISTPTGAASITSGFGTSPSFVVNIVQKEIQITVGTGGVSTTGVLGMPTALRGWDCKVNDLNTNIVTRQTAFTVSSVTFTAASAWTAGDKLLITCGAF